LHAVLAGIALYKFGVPLLFEIPVQARNSP